jgi:hypothetical protein
MFNHVFDRLFAAAKRRRAGRKAGRFAGKRKRPSAAGNGSSSYCSLEPRQLLAAATATTMIPSEIVASYSADFGSAAFSYQTNDGPLQDASTRLVPIGSVEDPVLGLTAGGGHPGLGKLNGRSIAYDRFAIVSYTVEESGYFEITDSVFNLRDRRSGGVEFSVFVETEKTIYSNVAQAGARFYFDTFLLRGLTVDYTPLETTAPILIALVQGAPPAGITIGTRRRVPIFPPAD